MKNKLQIEKLQQHAEPNTLQKHRSELMIGCIEYANEVHNGDRSADMAAKIIKGRREQYHDYYLSLSRQANAVDLDEMEVMFLETSKLFTPWDFGEMVKDRQAFDLLVAEIELLEMGNYGPDVLYDCFGDGEPCNEN